MTTSTFSSPPFQTKQSQIEEITLKSKNYLRITFHGHLTHEMSIQIAREWSRYMELHRPRRFNIIFHAQYMTDYDPMARIHWQDQISRLKMQINSLWIVTDSIILKGGAKLMGLFTSFPIAVVESEDEITS